MQPTKTITLKQIAERLIVSPQQAYRLYFKDQRFPKPCGYIYVGTGGNKKTRVFNSQEIDDFFKKYPPVNIEKRIELKIKKENSMKNKNRFNQLAFAFLTKKIVNYRAVYDE